MRRLILHIFLILLLSPLLTGQDLASVLEAHYKAAGQEKMQKVETIITTGKNTYSSVGFESTFKIFQARPDKFRVESDYQGAKVIQTYNGAKGWKYAPAMGIPEAEVISDKELKLLLEQIQFENPIWNYTERGARLELAKEADEKADHLILTSAQGIKQHFYIDRDSHLISKIETRQLLGGSENRIEVLLSAYKSEKGIPFSRRMLTRMNGEPISTLYIEKIEINRKIDSLLFEKVPSD